MPTTPKDAQLNNDPACAQASPQNNGNAYEHGEGESEAPALTEADLVPFTSRVVAAARAIESRRHDRLFNDYLAELLAGSEALQVYRDALLEFAAVSAKKGDKKAPTTTGSMDDGPNQSANGTDGHVTEDVSVSRRVAIRTKFGDDFFESSTRSPQSIKQMVLLGAGMDTRGYRLRAGPDTTVFEVDQAVVLDFKAKILSGSSAKKLISDKRLDGVGEARVVSVKANFTQAGWQTGLFEAGFDPTLPSAWVLEGLIMYLEEDEVAKLVQTITNLSSPGSAFCASVITGEWFKHTKSSDNEIFRSLKWGSDDPQAFFEGHFPNTTWSIKCVMIGTPGAFPDGADYSTGYNGWGHAYVTGYAA